MSLPYPAFEQQFIAMLSLAQWEQLLGRPEDQSETAQLKEQLRSAASDLFDAKKRLLNGQERADEAWLAEASEERMSTIERVLGKLRASVEQLQQQHDELAQLALAEAKPTPSDQAAVIKERVA